MPIYEYRCNSCGHEKEVLQRMSDKPLTKCPECGKRTFHKLVSAAGFQLKGTGWYATDFKNSGAKPAAKADKSGAKPDKPAESIKPAASSSKESSTSESSTSAGTPSA
ncbi:MAG: FmdB family transcriptional regulator [Betaproteobacteria bacterium RIFCSPLOWO2_02_FULL_67_26]|nr:MAG: FmdB family transcriptional regulator [Betaproteobacteria bacterium RIFCSPLOWO2_02_FULL_67_26]